MFIRTLLLAVGIVCASAGCAADDNAAQKWQAGTSYQVIDPPQATASADKIEVLEVFSYACPHCEHFQPYADKLKASLPPNAQFALLPADFHEIWVTFARGFYTAKALGLVDATHQAMFDAIYRDHQPMTSLDQIADFYAAHGADKAAFLSTAQSFVIDGDLARGHDLEIKYGIDSTPTLIVNGKYRVVANTEKKIGFDEMVEIAQYLVAREAAAKR
ncbi:MAG: thiol:disulfide interchange protein DsbA/DsbL [Dokdonella sp.]